MNQVAAYHEIMELKKDYLKANNIEINGANVETAVNQEKKTETE